MENHSVKVELYELLEDDNYLKQVWGMLCDYDKVFKPNLSYRDSVIDYKLIEYEDECGCKEVSECECDYERKPMKFYKDLKKFSFILYIVDGEVKSFLAYKKGYKLSSLRKLVEGEVIYVAFSLVRESYRSQGLFFVMNSVLESYYRKRYDYITRRVSSQNMAMINSLTRKNDYTIGNVVENERGEGVHTLSLYKRMG